MSLTWREALKQFNDNRLNNNEGRYMIPKKGTPEYGQMRTLMGEDNDAQELKDKPVPRSKSRTPKPQENKQTQTPAWVDEPKPVGKVNKSTKTVKEKAEESKPIEEPKPLEKPKKAKKNKTENPPKENTPKENDFVVAFQ